MNKQRTDVFVNTLTKVLMALFVICLSSCGDAELAKKANGVWQTSIEVTEDDGTTYPQTVTLNFTYADSKTKDGGTFVERVVSHLEEEEGEIVVNCTTTSTISGEWEVLMGDLHMTYNLSSLNVSITDLDFDISDDTDLYATSMYGLDTSIKNGIKDEIQREIYKNMHDEYSETNGNEGNGIRYTDLSIENDIMSFNTLDNGNIELTRVNGNIQNKKQSSSKPNLLEEKGAHLSLSGGIGSNDVISMELYQTGNETIVGSYYYLREGIERKLSGAFDDGILVLNQYNENGDLGETFKGVLDEKGYKGFTTALNGEKYEFELTIE